VYVTVAPPAGSGAIALGVIGTVLGGTAFLFAWIPLVGCVSIPFAFLGLLLGFIGFLLARPRKGITVAAMVVAGCALLIQIFWLTAFGAACYNSRSQSRPVSPPPITR
jgi:hypothetical protein